MHKSLFSVSMESLSPQVVSAAKLPIMNPNEFDLWKMRMEQYFLMTDYSLWEVILNGDFSIPTRVIDGVIQPVTPTTAEQRLARKNELKARGKGFFGVDTLLIEGMLVPQQAADDVDDVVADNVHADDVDDVVAEDAAEPTPPSTTPTTTPLPLQELPSTS
nr:ribonuclease H-like domain-containing protein [Tanacetum cinerariifolium]